MKKVNKERAIYRCYKQYQRICTKLSRIMVKRGLSEVPQEDKQFDRYLKRVWELSKKAYLIDGEYALKYYPGLTLNYLDGICKEKPVCALGYDHWKAGDPKILKQLKKAAPELDYEQLDRSSPTNVHTIPKSGTLLFKIYTDLDLIVSLAPNHGAVLNYIKEMRQPEIIKLVLQYLGYRTYLK